MMKLLRHKIKRKDFILLCGSIFLQLRLARATATGAYSQIFSREYNMPSQKFGKRFWSIIPSDSVQAALTYDLLAESIVGLTALAVNEGDSDLLAWIDIETDVYRNIKKNLPMEELGTIGAWKLLGRNEIREAVKGYILYDITNHESINCAVVAAHVHRGVLIEKNEANEAERMGYKCLYDASAKSLVDCWTEFGDKCNNSALVLMPALTSSQRSTAIASKLMVVNLNKVSNKPNFGNNRELLLRILSWLKPLSPVLGWEQGVGEDTFVKLVSRTGNFMIPCDWIYNTPLLWAESENKEIRTISTIDPAKIEYGDARHYMTFYMSDGDNVQWMFGSYEGSKYFTHPDVSRFKMTFGFPVINLPMISPDRYIYLLGKQGHSVSLVESFGGGYYYADNFGELKDRQKFLESAAHFVTVNMQKHGCKVLSLVCMDVLSESANEAYSAFIRNNDELTGIIVIQYTPYAGGKGNIKWFTNSKGYHIPIITVRYSIWNYGEGINGEVEGTPAYIASKYNDMAKYSPMPTFSITSVHAWSRFFRTDDSKDLTGENRKGGTVGGTGAALLCSDKLDDGIKIVNAEELIWQLRMYTYPEQTKEILSINH